MKTYLATAQEYKYNSPKIFFLMHNHTYKK